MRSGGIAATRPSGKVRSIKDAFVRFRLRAARSCSVCAATSSGMRSRRDWSSGPRTGRGAVSRSGCGSTAGFRWPRRRFSW